MKQYWDRIKAWLEKEKLVNEIVLNKGVSTKEIHELEALIEAKLPKDFTAFYKIYNGQLWEDGVTELIQDEDELPEILLSFEEIIREWKIWVDLFNNNVFEYPSNPSSPNIKSDWYNRYWIPFTSDGCGNHLCLDLDPAKGGVKGQVIRLIHDDEERTLIAHSFTEWIDAFISEKDGQPSSFMKEGAPFLIVLDEVLSKRKEKSIKNLVRMIRKYPTLKRMDTLYDINHLAEILFVFDDYD